MAELPSKLLQFLSPTAYPLFLQIHFSQSLTSESVFCLERQGHQGLEDSFTVVSTACVRLFLKQTAGEMEICGGSLTQKPPGVTSWGSGAAGWGASGRIVTRLHRGPGRSIGALGLWDPQSCPKPEQEAGFILPVSTVAGHGFSWEGL